jgi:rhodanese-related sulfurtransferase
MENIFHKNTRPLVIGTILILVIFFITFLRFSFSHNQPDTASQLQAEIDSTLKKATKISTSQLAQKINTKESLNIIDIREAGDYAQEHLPNSSNIPLSNLKNSISILEKNKTYTLIDTSALLTTTAYGVKTFLEEGFNNVTYLDGGFVAWKNTYNQTISAGNPNSLSDQSKVSYIDSEKLKEMLEKEKNIALIDVRKKTDYAGGHLKGALNIFLADLESKKQEIPTSGKIILYDADGSGAAFQAAVRLFDMGIFNAYTLSDGLNTWQSKKFEVVK